MTSHTDTPPPTTPLICFHPAPLPTTPPANIGDVRSRYAILGFRPERERVPEVRHVVTRLLRHWGIAPEVQDTAALAVSELTTNAILHSPASTSVTVVVKVTDQLHIEVRDGSSQLPVPQNPDNDEDEHGRGLALVTALCSDWGTTAYEDGGKSVWACFPLVPDSTTG